MDKVNSILIVDTYYPKFLEAFKINMDSSYEVQHQRIIEESFGTADYYSKNLVKQGWYAKDIIFNYDSLQELWRRSHKRSKKERFGLLQEQIDHYNPDVVFFQDLSCVPAEFLKKIGEKRLLAGQCSCPFPPEENVKQFKVLFTSFPHYLDRFRKLGVRGIFNRLAFESSLLNRIPTGNKKYDVVFTGGVGTPSHWQYGMKVLEHVAENIPSFKCWGYGYELLPESSHVKQKYQGEAWGRKMYEILGQAKIVLNRHGEVALNYANNMRLYEATGMGALLMTDQKSNLHDYFRIGSEILTYSDPKDAVSKIETMLENDDWRRNISERGQERTLKEHTYFHTMKTVSDTLKEMLGD